VPLAGTPLLEYTLEFLERGGIHDIILVTSTLPSQLRGYLSSSRWGQQDYPVRVKVVGMAVVRSVGDALREIDRQGLVKSDFVLLRGGLLTNLHLPFVVEEHRRIQALEKDKLLMTMVNSQGKNINNAFDSQRLGYSCCIAESRNLRDACLHVLDENQNASESTNYDFQQCLLLEHLEVYPDRKRLVHLSKEISSIHKDVTFRNDLSDCYIDICTPEVPYSFLEDSF
jgi:translation initiation factor eIF-2B subunit epsilon